MVPHTCHQCGATVAADEQFCPTCGAFQDPLASPRPKNRGNVISVSSDGPYEEFDLGSAPPPDEPSSVRKLETPSSVTCPSCGADNPARNKHCQECGARLSQQPLPTAPRPAVQATAGVRAAMAISGLLFTVIVVALLFNVFSGGSPTPTTVASVGSTTSPEVTDPGPVDIISVECTPDEAIGAFVCDNLVSGTNAEYQINWEELPEGEPLTIRLTFRQPMTISRIDWTNLTDPDRFKQNYRARGLLLSAPNNPAAFPQELDDTPGTQSFAFAAVNATFIEIEILTPYDAQVTNGNVFSELAIDEITVIGRPYTAG